MEVRRSLLSSEDGNVLREHRVERAGDPLRRRAGLDLDAHDLAERVDPRVRSSGDGESLPGRKDLIEGRAQLALDRPQRRLRGPTAKGRPVVLECELEARRYCAGAGAVSSTGSWTVRTIGAGGT
jgi:hypothetical protein